MEFLTDWSYGDVSKDVAHYFWLRGSYLWSCARSDAYLRLPSLETPMKGLKIAHNCILPLTAVTERFAFQNLSWQPIQIFWIPRS